jgi:hypothetical protein
MQVFSYARFSGVQYEKSFLNLLNASEISASLTKKNQTL